MTAAGLRISPVDAAAAGLDRVLGRLRDGFVRYVDARSRAVAIRHLERLSDAALRDLGVPRSRIREFVRAQALPWS
jgi:uncharacterized protein YjiS (DUF1127 family)